MFKVNVESSIGWIEMTETLEEAVELLRGLVEADGKHAFYNMTNFHNSGIKSKNASCQLQWVTEENGQVKLISKSIMWINYYEDQRKIHGNDYEEWRKNWAAKWNETRESVWQKFLAAK